MFTRLFLLFGMIVFLSVPVFAQGGGEIVEIGQATTKTTLSPIYTPKNYSFTQQLYTAEEIGTDGIITSIAFHWAYNGSKTFGIDVYMKHTERSYFETSADRIPLSASDKVFTGTINPDHDSWITITLDEPFEYDGSSNLVIAVHRTSGSPGFNDLDNNWNVIPTWYYTSTDSYTMLYMGDDQSQYVSLSPAYMTPSNYRPNIQIEISSSTITCKAPKNFAANNVTNNSATLTWTAGEEGQNNWDVYLTQTSAVVPDENTDPTFQVTECTKALTGLTAQTTYYAYVRTACGGDDGNSKWAKTIFTTTREAYHVSAISPYRQDFENGNDWTFANGTLTNQWHYGNATHNGNGSNAIYISDDNGATNHYTINKAAVVYASKLFNFDQGTYSISFDWNTKGESSYDFIRVALVPGDKTFTAGGSLPSGVTASSLPNTWIALDGGSKLNQSNGWQTKVSEKVLSGTYTMVFMWRNDNSTGTQPPAAIDNISISMPNVFAKAITKYTEGVKDHYCLIASPVGEVNPENVKNMLENRYDLYQFDQSQELEWRNYNQDGGFNLEPGKGYLYANSEDVTLIFKGTPYNGDGQVTLTKDENASFAGWNLVGNPFAQKAYITKPFYTLNPEGTEVIAGTGNSVSAMEGLFVVAETDGETLTFSTNNVVQPSRQIVVNVTQNRGVAIDRAIVRFGEGLMLPKFQISDDSPKIYIPMDGQAYAVVRSENIGKLPLNFNVEENGTYSIHVDAEDIELCYLHLIDNMTGADIDLLENPCYTFEAKTSDYASRFKLVFATHDSSTIGNNFAFIDANGNIIVNCAETGTTMQIVDITGRVIVSIDGRTASVPTAGMTAGVYVLRLINGNDMKTQKIVVR